MQTQTELHPSGYDARWDALLTSDAGQTALDRLADEALASIRAGESRRIVFTADGEITPG